MENTSAKNIIAELLQYAGITIDGNARYDIQIFYTRVLHERELWLGESYVEG